MLSEQAVSESVVSLLLNSNMIVDLITIVIIQYL